MLQFQGFKPDALKRIAGTLGYQGDMNNFEQYLMDNPDKKQTMDMYNNKAMQMAMGGAVKKFVDGGVAFDEPYVGMPPNGIDPNDSLSKLSDIPYQVATTPEFIRNELRKQQSDGLQPVQQATTGNMLAGILPSTGVEITDGQPLGPSIGVNANTGDVSYNYTYEQAVARQAQRDIKSPEEAAAIQAALQTGNSAQSTNAADPRAIPQQYIPQTNFTPEMNLQDVMVAQAKTPGLPTGATVVPMGTQMTAEQFVSPTSGQVVGATAVPTALAATAQAQQQQATAAGQMAPAIATPQVSQVAAQTQAAQAGTPEAIQAAQQNQSALSSMQAAQGTANIMTNPAQREIQAGEMVSGAADATKAAQFTEQVQAAQALPSEKATVQGQLEGLMQDFAGGQTPAWAAGAMRAATAQMAARGLGASSLAGQAIIQATMEAALPIAQADASTMAQFEQQNLSNRQQRAMLAAQQRAQFIGQEFDQAFQARVQNSARIGDIANMNFTAEQQIALENSRAANTMNLSNLSNRQAMVMAEAGALANLDMANLNNRQQAAVQNAQNFLQVDMANLSNQQQTELFTAQQRIQSLFTDQAAINAAQQFNATSQNQTDQFFASLASNTAQFNATQANAQAQFNAGQVNVLERFNAEINNQREQFNAQNRLVIDQANAQWRREIATADTAAVNRANEINASSLLGTSQSAYNNLWQYYADNMEWAWTSAENERKRINDLAMVQLQADAQFDAQKYKSDAESSAGFGQLIGSLFTSDLSKTLAGSILGGIF
jgi:hypothetical protein